MSKWLHFKGYDLITPNAIIYDIRPNRFKCMCFENKTFGIIHFVLSLVQYVLFPKCFFIKINSFSACLSRSLLHQLLYLIQC